ncbi:MAG TPA: methionine aminotransferase [Steroidobacteraceae bacterium]|nr:methionine aminotransferase [Steroidobacteraceae bacterium]
MTSFERSKLPDVGTTIFTVMSRRARELGALNLGQGFPDYDIDPLLAAHLARAVGAGYDQYAPMEGVSALRELIAARATAAYGTAVDPEGEVTITLGATEALYSAIQAVVGAGDEVIVFDPVYDSYEPAVRLAGGRCVHLPLLPPGFRHDWERVRAAITPRTRLLIINSPHNPACTVATAEDLGRLEQLAQAHGLIVLSDEVYEHVVFGQRHASILARPGLRARGIAVFSFGKALHATGWRVGYAVAPPPLTRELRRVHQFNTFSIPHPLQQAITGYLAERPQAMDDLAAFFQGKRDRLLAALAGSAWRAPPAQGTYFQLLDYGGLAPQYARLPDVEFADRLLTQAGVAAIPLSPFYLEPPPLTCVRLCVAKRDATLEEAARRLRRFATGPLRAVEP